MNASEFDMDALLQRMAAARAAMPPQIREAHKLSSGQRDAIAASAQCGCFYCLATFDPSEIRRWVDDKTTPICPRCGIDSVLPDNVGVPLDRDFLKEMQFHWFESSQCQYKS
jgi:hypothetical protein